MTQSRFAPSIVVALIFSVAAVVCTSLVTSAALKIKNRDQMIRVTGSARKLIRSDLIIWDGRVTARAPQMALAYQNLKAGMDRARAYLVKKGVAPKDIMDRPIETRTLYAPAPRPAAQYGGGSYPGGAGAPPPPGEGDEEEGQGAPSGGVYRAIMAYELSQSIEVRSTSVEQVDRLARTSTELISSGVMFESAAPRFIYTKLGDLKITMLADAAKDARNRAQQIAENSGCALGEVRFAHMGVMRITPAYTTVELSEYGSNDTSAIDKEITAIVTMGFGIR